MSEIKLFNIFWERDDPDNNYRIDLTFIMLLEITRLRRRYDVQERLVFNLRIKVLCCTGARWQGLEKTQK